MKSWRILMLISIVIGIIWLVWLDYTEPNPCRQYFNDFKSSDFKGVVVKKYIDNKQHNSKVLIIENDHGEKLITFDWDKSIFYEYIQKGDRIRKEIGDSAIIILRQDTDTIIIIDYGCKP
jgi:hypothetical protein